MPSILQGPYNGPPTPVDPLGPVDPEPVDPVPVEPPMADPEAESPLALPDEPLVVPATVDDVPPLLPVVDSTGSVSAKQPTSSTA